MCFQSVETDPKLDSEKGSVCVGIYSVVGVVTIYMYIYIYVLTIFVYADVHICLYSRAGALSNFFVCLHDRMLISLLLLACWLVCLFACLFVCLVARLCSCWRCVVSFDVQTVRLQI